MVAPIDAGVTVDALIGGQSFGPYQLQKLLGRGGMGEVWQAHDTIAERVVAVKVLPLQWAQDETFQQRFRREAQAAARLNEPHVVPIHTYGEIDGRLFVEMRLIEGRDLHRLLANGPLVPARAVAIIDQVAHALDAVHDSGLVHRDVKPSNILITQYDFAYLIDFGIARAAQETGLTSAGHFVGTMHYMAPERFRGDEVDSRVDVYALACVLLECLTAVRPFAGNEAERQVMAHLTVAPPQPSTMNPAVAAQFDAVIAKGMAKDPAERYQTPLELAMASRDALTSGEPTASQHLSTPRAPVDLGTQAHAPSRIAGSDDASLNQQATSEPEGARPPSIDDLLDRAVLAIHRGDVDTALAFPGQPDVDRVGGSDADDLLAAPSGSGEIRRLTIVATELADPTSLSMRVDPETYRLVVGRYRDVVMQVAQRYEGHVNLAHSEGMQVVFGFPRAHEDDVERAVKAGTDITGEMTALSEQAQRRFGIAMNARVGIHRGPVYLDRTQDDVYGLAANLASTLCALAPPGTVLVSDTVEPLIRRTFDTAHVDGAALQAHGASMRAYRVTGERVAPARISIGPVVGRDREIALLHKKWRRAQRGTLATPGVVYRGEPGIGKSRLAADATALVESDGRLVIELTGSPLHPDAGLHPIRSLLEKRCGIGRLTEPAQRLRLLHAEVTSQGVDSAAVPLLAPVLGIGTEHGYKPAPAEGRKLQALIGQAVQRYLLACFGGGPGLIVAEDAHWFDSATIELMTAVLGATEGRLLVVVTGRPGVWLPDGWPAKVFDLATLTDAQADALIMALDPTISPEQCVSVRTRCDGVPFYIEQVVSGLRSPSRDGEQSVPDQLYEPLFARLSSTPHAVTVIEVAAVIGRHVDRSLLQAVLALDADDIDDAVDDLEDAGVLEPHSLEAWRFRHELLREVAAELAPPSRRRELHTKVADALVEVVGGEPDWRLVATHYEQAQRFVQAASACQQAATDARRRGALDEARSYLTRAIDQLQNAPGSLERDRLEIPPRLARGFLTAASEGYQSPAIAADFERCLQLAGTDPHDDQLFASLVALCSYYVPRADLRRADQLVEMLESATGEKRLGFRPAIDSAKGMVAFQRGEFISAKRYFESAAEGLSAEGEHLLENLWFMPDDPVALAHEHLAMIHLLRGDFAAAEAHFTHAAARADKLGFPQGPYNHLYAMDMEIWMRIESGQYERARILIGDMIEKGERYGFDFFQMFGATEQCLLDSSLLLASAHRDTALLESAISTMTGFIDLWRSVGVYAYQTHYDCVLAQLLIAAGRLQEARKRVDAALHIADETGMHFYDAELLRARSHTHPDSDSRAADLTAAIELARVQSAPLFALRAALDDFATRGEPARTSLAEAADLLSADTTLIEATRARAILLQT